MRQILIAGDDPKHVSFLRSSLAHAGFACRSTNGMAKARLLLRTCTPDLFLLDARLSDGSGLDFCRDLRREPRFAKAYVAIVTGARTISNGVDWWRAGADTCWTKTNNPTRLTSLVSALLRRKDLESKVCYPQLPDIAFDAAAGKVECGGIASKALSHAEFLFMNMLFNAYPGDLPRPSAYERLYPGSMDEEPRYQLNHLVKRLRMKLPRVLSAAIHSIRNEGYILAFSPEKAPKSGLASES